MKKASVQILYTFPVHHTMSSVVVPRPIPVALLGLGGVGKAILSQLLSPPLSAQFQLVLIANSRQSLSLPLPAAPITPANFQSILEKHGAPLNVTSVISVLSTHPDAPGIFIDSTGSDVIPAMYPQILSMGVHIVTPNKKGFSASEALYKAIAEKSFPNTPYLAYGESTVGAGLPIIQTLKDLVATGDEIEKIEGVFSGTLSYIFNEFSKPEDGNVKFSEVVKVAKEKGYTVSCVFLGVCIHIDLSVYRSLILEMISLVPTSPESSPSSPDSFPPLPLSPKATLPSLPNLSFLMSSPTLLLRRSTLSDSRRVTSSLPTSGRRPRRRVRW